MKMRINNKWIIGMTALFLMAAVMVARHQMEITDDSASSTDPLAIRTPRVSHEPANDANHQIPAENRTLGESVGLPDDKRADEQGTRFPGKSAQQEVVGPGGTTRDAKQARMVEPDGIEEEDGDASKKAALASPPPGVQLAADVRLPVAALPIDFETNEVTAKMLGIIVDDYYRDLAAGVLEDEEEIQTTRRLEEGGETTILVRNGPAAEAARQRADWRFRAIFGKDAFNRMSMQSNLEARLPVTGSE